MILCNYARVFTIVYIVRIRVVSMDQKITRIFTCENGHSYESKEPITTMQGAMENNNAGGIFGMIFGKMINPNDMCKICLSKIIKEDDYVDGKIVMGAVYCPK